MNGLRMSLWRLAFGIVAFTLAAPSYAVDQSTESFDADWPSGIFLGTSVYTNNPTTNPISGWVVNGARLRSFGSALSSPNVAEMQQTGVEENSWIQTPAFTNGLGRLIFYTRSATADPLSYNVESSSDLSQWTTNASYTLSSANVWVGHTNVFNTDSNLYLRIRKTTDLAGKLLYVDSCSVSYRPGTLTVTNAAIAPTAPRNGDTVTVSAQISVNGTLGGSPNLTLLWRDLFSPNWNSAEMATNEASAYVTTSAIPARAAGAVVQYYVRAVYDNGDGAMVTNTYPASGASAPLAYTVRELASFSNMTVQGSINTNLLLVSPYQWQSAVPAVSLTNAYFNFRGVSNAVTVTWGDTDPATLTLPVYGTAEVTPATITVAGVTRGGLSFSFNEQSGDYTIQPCAADNLESWPHLPSGAYTNNGWALSGGRVTNEPARALQGSFALLGGKSVATNSFLRSPYLTNGVGQIGFWFRSFENGGSPTGVIAIQKAASPTSSTWTTIATTNTTSTNYLYFSVGQSDRDSHAVRILNNVGGNDAAVCLDEVFICEPGAGVTFSNVLSTPSPATLLDPVTISANIDAQGGATNLQAWTLFRFGTNGAYDTLTMTNDTANRFVTTEPIPRFGVGTVQYLILCSYTGFQSGVSSPVYFPSDTNTPNTYTVQAASDGRLETFDADWPAGLFLGTSVYTNAPTTNPVSGWVANGARLRSLGASLSMPNVAEMQQVDIGENSWIQTPLFTNGIGAFSFYARSPSAEAFTFNIESSSNGVSWVTNASYVLNAANVWTGYTNVFGTTNALYLRIRKTSEDLRLLYLDNCLVTYPPARVAITNVVLVPGYPSTTDAVNVSCVITSLNAMFPAANFNPTLYYRKGGTAPYTAISMLRGADNRYTTSTAIPTFPRDTPVEYYVRCDFSGYYGAPGENQSPAFHPASGPTGPTNYVVRAFSSPYEVVNATINGVEAEGRLLSDRTWQAVALIEAPTNRLTITFNGLGYSAGTGYATSAVSWGHTNNWQPTLPLADQAFTNHGALSVAGNFKGQYAIRFNEDTGEYLVIKCLWQDFDEWDGSAGKYIQAANDSATPASLNFDSWTNNETRVRTEAFEGGTWPSMSSFTNGASGGVNGYVIYGSRIQSVSPQFYTVRTKDSPVAPGQGFAAQGSGLGFFPLRGIGTISAKYRPVTASPARTFGIYLQPTNASFVDWTTWSSVFSVSGLTNTAAFSTTTLTINTNQTYNVLFSHVDGENGMYLDDLSVSEWYADTKTVDGWTAAESWIENSLQAGGGKACRLDVSRADPGASQYIQSPMMTNGVNTISFQFGGISNYPTSFDLQLSYGDPNTFSSVLRQTNTFSGAGSNYTAVSYAVRSDASNIYIRLVNTTPSPGVLLVDNLRVGPYALPSLWAINNAAIDEATQQAPPLPRQFYATVCYLNSNRTSDVSTDEALRPASNLYPYVRSAYLDEGIGEISFWYRNWAISGASVPPATLVIETAETSSTNAADWTPVAVITNIVNTNDYRYFRTAVYQPNSHYVRIYNYDAVPPVGRVCLDDILVTAPIAASLSISNMVPIPQQPVYTDRVDVAVDLYNFFLSPSNLDVRTYYAVATNHAGLATAPSDWRMMSCTATNLAAPGKWYRYKTTVPIPTNATDTFVSYWVTVRFDGLLSELSTPISNRAFGVYPSWYDPMNAVYGTNSAYYVVYSSPPGSVWINEVNYLDNGYEYDKQYIELCGKAGVDIRNWIIDIEDAYNGFVAQYVLTNNTILNNETNGHGFWVLGKPAVANIDMELNNEYAWGDYGQSLPSWNGGRLSLRRSWGAAEHKVAYESAAEGYEFIGLDFNSVYYGSLGLSGSGTNRGDFTWAETEGFSPGAQNVAQELYDYVTEQEVNPPTITITDFWVNTNVWIVCTRTNGWYPAPWFTTNLLDTNAWEAVPVFARSQTATNAVINFTTPAGSQPHFYSIEATNAP